MVEGRRKMLALRLHMSNRMAHITTERKFPIVHFLVPGLLPKN
jgi:hypothetical protein